MSKGMLFLVIVLFGGSLSLAQASSLPLTPVTVQLKWLHQFQSAGFYAAQEKGFYKAAGLDVRLLESAQDVDPVTEVIEGRADYGVAGPSLLYYKMQGVGVTALAVLFQHSPMMLMSLAESNLATPADLAGKRVMLSLDYNSSAVLSMLKQEGVGPNDIQVVPHSFDLEDLIRGRVDAMAVYSTNYPYLMQKRKIAVNLMYPRNYGVDFYGDTLFTQESRIHSRPDEVHRFREATLQGWRYAMEHPDEVIDLILEKYSDRLSWEELAYEADAVLRVLGPDPENLGRMNPGRWLAMAETFVSLGKAPTNYDLKGFIYSPNAVFDETGLRRLLWGLGVVCALGVVGIFLLGLFNRRLRKAVDRKTELLVKANEALFRHTQNLVEKERALFRLNQELELKVEERTQELAKTNLELQRELDERAQRELSLRLLSKAADSSRSGIVVADAVGMIVYVNAAFLELVGLEEEQVLNKHTSALGPKIQLPECGANVLGRRSQSQVRTELECLGPDNQRLWVQVSVSGIEDDQGQVSHYVLACEDITQLKRSKDEMERLAYHDSLTGLENRELFRLRLEKAIAQAEREKIKTALMFIDIDHFKQINDNFGHDAGDEVLRTVATRIKQNIRTHDTVARISGDEFTVLISRVLSNDDVRKVAQGILKTLTQPIKLSGNEYFVSASIGISITPDDGTEVDELMKNADLAMYEAKRNGRNNFQFFSRRLNEEARRNLVLEQELKSALMERRFFIDYQPRICLRTMELAGMEALVRWEHKDKGTVYPDAFMDFAEDSGLIVELGKWVLQESSRSAVQLQDAGLGNIRLSVNVSGRQIRDRSFMADISDIVLRAGDVARNLELELTEASLIEQHKESIQCVQALRQMGFALTLDDFGTGYSSLSCLKSFPVNYVKIDESFVQGLPHERASVETVRAIIAMSHSLEIKVVAEGVETEAQLQFLKECGCDFAQGFYFGKAMPLRNLISRYKALPISQMEA